MPLNHSKSAEAFTKNLKAEIGAGKPKNQALAIAYRVQRDAMHKAGGGPASPPFYARAQARNLEHAGMIHSPIAGRTDKLPISVRSGSYIIPADVVSALGQGNSMSGANGLNRMLKMGPYGSAASGVPKVSAMRPRKMFADGGEVDGEDAPPVDIVAAGGEYSVPPEKVAEIGGGDVAKGHDILDAMVMHIRKKNIKTLKSLPKPKKN